MQRKQRMQNVKKNSNKENNANKADFAMKAKDTKKATYKNLQKCKVCLESQDIQKFLKCQECR